MAYSYLTTLLSSLKRNLFFPFQMTKFMFVILLLPLLVIKLFSTLCASFCSTKNFINERNNLSLWRINYLFSWSWMFFAIILIWKTLSVYVHVNDKTTQCKWFYFYYYSTHFSFSRIFTRELSAMIKLTWKNTWMHFP